MFSESSCSIPYKLFYNLSTYQSKPHQKTSPDEWINPGETSFDLSNLEFISHLIIPTTNHSRTKPGDQTISKLLGGKPVGFLRKI
jgi:hypothetical protein